MKIGVMITNGGTHPPEKWAEQSAEHIVDCVQIAESYPGYEAALQDKNVTRDKIAAALVEHHAGVQESERGLLSERGSVHLASELSPVAHCDAALAAVNEAVKDSMFAGHFAKPDTQQYIRNVLASHFATAMHVERQWHASKIPNDPHARAFRAQHSGA